MHILLLSVIFFKLLSKLCYGIYLKGFVRCLKKTGKKKNIYIKNRNDCLLFFELFSSNYLVNSTVDYFSNKNFVKCLKKFWQKEKKKMYTVCGNSLSYHVFFKFLSKLYYRIYFKQRLCKMLKKSMAKGKRYKNRNDCGNLLFTLTCISTSYL